MNFENFKGKKIRAYDYFNTLIQLGWKYDREESDLFDRLSKTFWREGIKVFLVFDEYCCIPPQEDVIIKDIIFFKFDKEKHTAKNVYTNFEERSKNKQYFKFESVEKYIAHLELDYPYIIPYSDFNTEDFHLLESIEIKEVSNAIQKEVWTDLCFCES